MIVALPRKSVTRILISPFCLGLSLARIRRKRRNCVARSPCTTGHEEHHQGEHERSGTEYSGISECRKHDNTSCIFDCTYGLRFILERAVPFSHLSCVVPCFILLAPFPTFCKTPKTPHGSTGSHCRILILPFLPSPFSLPPILQDLILSSPSLAWLLENAEQRGRGSALFCK
jgi:hypothetical protein